jgi:hypothetical protein
MQYGLGVRRIILNSNRPVSEYVYFWMDDLRDKKILFNTDALLQRAFFDAMCCESSKSSSG